MQVREKGTKVTTQSVFPMFCGSGGPKGRLARAAGAEPAGQMKDEKLHAVVARSTLGSQKCQNTSGSDDFWKLRRGKSTFPSQNAQNTSGSERFWKLTCRKSARPCSAKRFWK